MPDALDYPALYKGAGKLSAEGQRMYLALLRLEYILLIIGAALTMPLADNATYYVLRAFIFLLALATLIYRTATKPDQDWYKGRALAESIKTSTWRFCMRAAPFGDADTVNIPIAQYRNFLKAILASNRHIGQKLPPDSAANDQITASMLKVRCLSLTERAQYYLEYRIKEQRLWYQTKATDSKRIGLRWATACGSAYLLAISLSLLQIAHPTINLFPIEPLIVIASSIVGWIQIKKFGELASSYALTAHEIGIVQGQISEVISEESMSNFVNEAELAFSREHTQWTARTEAQSS